MSIKDFINNLINSLLDGSFERVRIINQMNTAFKEYFLSGEFGRMCRVSISQGQSEYAHEMSTLSFRSGFKITIENDLSVTDCEINELSSYRYVIFRSYILVVKEKVLTLHHQKVTDMS